MSRETINLICAELPGTERSDPWGGGHDAWKVGGRMFALIGAAMPGVSVKCRDAEQAEMLIAAGIARKAPYMHASWVNIPFEMPEAELRHWIVESYEMIRKKLPKSIQVTLDRTSG